jgi:glycosyltransferase involved in cell wall biosynthesis
MASLPALATYEMSVRLLLVADLPFPSTVNGVSIYLEDLQPRLHAGGLELALLCQGEDRGRFRLESTEESGTVRFVLRGSPIRYRNAVADPLPGCAESKTEAAFLQALRDFQPEIVHFHEFVRTPASCILMAKEFGAKVVVTLHDYWLICPRLLLFTPDEKVCEGARGGVSCVINCLGGSLASRIYRSLLARDWRFLGAVRRFRDLWKGVKHEPLGQRPGKALFKHYHNLKHSDLIEKLGIRERFMLAALNSADLILPVSRRVGEIFAHHGVDVKRIRPLNLGLPSATALTFRVREPRKPVRFGFLGHLGPAKGSHLIVESARSIDPGQALFLLYGGGDVYAAKELPQLSRTLPHIRYHGPYRRHELQTILDDLDVLVVPSIWEETLGLVAMEGLAAGVPVLAARIGGIPDIVYDGVNGLLFSPGDVAALSERIRYLLEEPGRIVGLSRGTRGTVASMEAHAETLLELYRGLLQ